jgi:hypothetical protein
MNGTKIIDSFAKLFCHHTNWQNATKAGRTNSRTNCQQNRIAISRILLVANIVYLKMITPLFSPGHMSMKNIKQQTLKRKKTTGSTHAGVEGMYSHKARLELVVQSEVDDTPKRATPLLLIKEC